MHISILAFRYETTTILYTKYGQNILSLLNMMNYILTKHFDKDWRFIWLSNSFCQGIRYFIILRWIEGETTAMLNLNMETRDIHQDRKNLAIKRIEILLNESQTRVISENYVTLLTHPLARDGQVMRASLMVKLRSIFYPVKYRKYYWRGIAVTDIRRNGKILTNCLWKYSVVELIAIRPSDDECPVIFPHVFAFPKCKQVMQACMRNCGCVLRWRLVHSSQYACWYVKRFRPVPEGYVVTMQRGACASCHGKFDAISQQNPHM